MTDWFMNINNTSGTYNGTSEATGWTDFNDVRVSHWGSSITGGDRLYVKAGQNGLTYGIEGGNNYFSSEHGNMALNNHGVADKAVDIIGYPYAGTTSDIPLGDDRPCVVCRRTNGQTWFMRKGGKMSNIRFETPPDATDNRTAHVDLSDAGTVVKNCAVVTKDGTIGDRMQNVNLAYGVNVMGCEFDDQVEASNWPTRDAGYNVNFTCFSSNEINGCVFKQRTPSFFFRFRNTYGRETWKNCIFIGTPNCLGIVDNVTYTAAGQQLSGGIKFDNCIFYNMGVGFNPPMITSAGSRTTESSWRTQYGAFSARNCIFENCGKAIKSPADYADPSGWVSGNFSYNSTVAIRDCVFAQNTTNMEGDLNEAGSVYATGSVFKNAAAGDFRLNDIPGRGALVKQKLPMFEFNLLSNMGFNPRPGENSFEEQVVVVSGSSPAFSTALSNNSKIVFTGTNRKFKIETASSGAKVFRRVKR